MNRLHMPLLTLALLFSAQGFAATEQQNRMTTCNADATAKSLKADARKNFMSTCLKATSSGTPQQQKMKTCNASATGESLKGDARKTFMSDCLKNK